MNRMLGGILLAVGILIAGGSGLCSIAMLFDGGGSQAMNLLLPVLFFGGIPFATGVLLIVGGRALLKSVPRDQIDQ